MASRHASMLRLSRFQSELDRLFQEALKMGESGGPSAEWQPAVDVVETPDAILILVEVPGLSPSDLKVEVKGTLVTLSGAKPTPLPSEQPLKFQCMERGHGRFVRDIQLFWPVNSHQGTASLADGLLTVVFPKIQDKRQAARAIPVREGGGGGDE
ncbi:MAG TPA: Hsp20/alpha crystallin family protein [Thermoanaerobaculia bacterium]|nr:Hsp20/alpha crystallin family protein [Thermoanaerobaculia bacterium]